MKLKGQRILSTISSKELRLSSNLYAGTVWKCLTAINSSENCGGLLRWTVPLNVVDEENARGLLGGISRASYPVRWECFDENMN